MNMFYFLIYENMVEILYHFKMYLKIQKAPALTMTHLLNIMYPFAKFLNGV